MTGLFHFHIFYDSCLISSLSREEGDMRPNNKPYALLHKISRLFQPVNIVPFNAVVKNEEITSKSQKVSDKIDAESSAEYVKLTHT